MKHNEPIIYEKQSKFSINKKVAIYFVLFVLIISIIVFSVANCSHFEGLIKAYSTEVFPVSKNPYVDFILLIVKIIGGIAIIGTLIVSVYNLRLFTKQ
ncbi:MAG: hypothetical protein ABUK01_17005, partial [Leptospirales bacterium]